MEGAHTLRHFREACPREGGDGDDCNYEFIDTLSGEKGLKESAMTHRDAGDYSKKHGPGETPNPAVAKAVNEAAVDGEIACAKVFAIASEQGISPAEAGKTVDLLKIRLNKCQLGLFGYSPEKSIVKPAEQVSPELESALRKGLAEERLPCATAWRIAEELNLKKMDVSSAAEALGIRIKPCQLGAF
jgi:hypothetical protein